MTGNDELGDGVPSSDKEEIGPDAADVLAIDPRVQSFLQSFFTNPGVSVYLDRKYRITLFWVAVACLLFAVIGGFLMGARDMSQWVFIGYVLPMIFWPLHLVGMPIVERAYAVQEGRSAEGIRNPWQGFQHKHARRRRISPFRGRLYFANMLIGLFITLALLTIATVELVKYLTD